MRDHEKDRELPLNNRELRDRELLSEEERRLTLSEEELAVGKREMRTGEVEVGKRVETEHVRENVPLRREEVTVEHRPITDPMHARDAHIGDEEVRMELRAEEAVVEKRVVPKEELVIRKHQVQDNQVVEADLHRERAEVRTEGNVQRTDGMRADGLDRGDLDPDRPL